MTTLLQAFLVPGLGKATQRGQRGMAFGRAGGMGRLPGDFLVSGRLVLEERAGGPGRASIFS